MTIEAAPPVEVLELLPEERGALLELLGMLSPQGWERETACPGWSVKDIALHLLGNDYRMLSSSRDRFPDEAPGSRNLPFAELVQIVDAANDLWVRASRYFSTPLLMSLLARSGEELHQHFRTVDPNAPGGVVAWAAPGASPNWLVMAREYTERWSHQQQIREAVSVPGMTEQKFFAPVLGTFARSLPRSLRSVVAPEGTQVAFVLSGEGGSRWVVRREEDRWDLYTGTVTRPAALVSMESDTAWRMFTLGMEHDEVRRHAKCSGDSSLYEPLLRSVAIIA